MTDTDRLRDWLVEQRWYASKTRAVTELDVVETVPLADDLALTLVQRGGLECRLAIGLEDKVAATRVLRSQANDAVQT